MAQGPLLLEKGPEMWAAITIFFFLLFYFKNTFFPLLLRRPKKLSDARDTTNFTT